VITVSGIDPAAVQKALLVFVRVAGIVGTAPLLGSQYVPAKVKIGLAVAVSVLVLPVVGPVNLSDSPVGQAALLCREFAVGAAVGFVTSLVFMGIRLAGSLVGVQMGFGVVHVMDPETREEVPIIGQMQYLLGALIFLAVDGHHWVLGGLARSFEIIPVGAATLAGAPTEVVARSAATVFTTAVKIAAPVTAALFLTDTALAFVARSVPQMNVFVVGFPLKIGVGLSLLLISLPLFAVVAVHLFSASRDAMISMIGAMAP